MEDIKIATIIIVAILVPTILVGIGISLLGVDPNGLTGLLSALLTSIIAVMIIVEAEKRLN